ncbi:YlaH-like family protein [Oceanobacillus sp. FSL H7-0719]|uniref:YlaH-like family protein n=1 Tax=Oceanobacillus sp. FSL H7-0719 TaxID=2954507 RepID=UPI0032493251
MTGSFSVILDFIISNYGMENVFLKMYLINLILSAVAYKLGFARKLSIGKNIFVYLMLAVGTYITTIFSIMMLPMTESLIIIVLVLAIYRARLHFQRKAKNAS